MTTSGGDGVAEFTEPITAAIAQAAGRLRGVRASLARGPDKLAEELPSLIAAMEKLPTELATVEGRVLRFLSQTEAVVQRAAVVARQAERVIAGPTADRDRILAELQALRETVKGVLR